MAIGKIFELQGGKIVPKEDCYIIGPLKKIIDDYPKDYTKILAYIHYMKSMNKKDNPYADVPLEQREEVILYDLQLRIDTQAFAIKNALDCVENMYYTTFYGVYKGLKSMLDKIGKQLELEEIDFNNKEGNANGIMRFMKDYEALRKNFKQSYQDFEEEQGGSRARGGADLADDEDDDYSWL